MTRIDERGPPIVVGDRDRARLSELFETDRDVVAAYLFGSQARGTPGPLSDVDLAVWLDPTLHRNDRSQKMLSLMGDAASRLGTDEVQVVVLNDAPPSLVHAALREGVRLVENDARQRVRLEVKAAVEYLDLAPLRRELTRGMARRIREGRFGRP